MLTRYVATLAEMPEIPDSQLSSFLKDQVGYEELVVKLVDIIGDIAAQSRLLQQGKGFDRLTLNKTLSNAFNKRKYCNHLRREKKHDFERQDRVDAKKQIDGLCNDENLLSSVITFANGDATLQEKLAKKGLTVSVLHKHLKDVKASLKAILALDGDHFCKEMIAQARLQSYSCPGIHYRPDVEHVYENQDSFYANPVAGIYAVFDGVSRSDKPQLAAQTMVRLCDEMLPSLLVELNAIADSDRGTKEKELGAAVQKRISALVKTFKTRIGITDSATTGAIWLTLVSGYRIGLFFGDASARYTSDEKKLFLNPITYISDYIEDEWRELDESEDWHVMSLSDIPVIKLAAESLTNAQNASNAGENALSSSAWLQPCVMLLKPEETGLVTLVSDQYSDNASPELIDRIHEDPALFGAMIDVLTMTFVRLQCAKDTQACVDISLNWEVDFNKWGDDATSVTPHLIKEKVLPPNLLPPNSV